VRPSVEALSADGHEEAFALRLALASGLLVPAEEARRLASRTGCLTMLAGAGSRGVASLKEAGAGAGGFDPEAPRGLFPVRNLLGRGPDPLPIAAYALAAVRDLGRHVIVVRGWEREIEEAILRPLSYAAGSWRFVTQEAPGGKPRGHGDAAFQAMEFWADAEYVIVNFGGDAASPLTALAALSAMDELAVGAGAPGLLLPAARVESPAYPISLDERGLPTGFGHAKLSGAGLAAGPGYSNVGVRVYRAAALREAIARIRERHWSASAGYAIPGNAPGDQLGGEFALDNVDALLAAEGRARILAVARPEELSPVKAFSDLPRFERDMAVVARDWDELYSNSGRGLEKK